MTRWRLHVFIRADSAVFFREWAFDVTEISGIDSTLCWLCFHCPLMFYQVPAETEADKPQREDWSQDSGPSQSQTSASSLSAFQLIANAFRRTFSVTNPSKSSNTAVVMYVWNTLLVVLLSRATFKLKFTYLVSTYFPGDPNITGLAKTGPCPRERSVIPPSAALRVRHHLERRRKTATLKLGL